MYAEPGVVPSVENAGRMLPAESVIWNVPAAVWPMVNPPSLTLATPAALAFTSMPLPLVGSPASKSIVRRALRASPYGPMCRLPCSSCVISLMSVHLLHEQRAAGDLPNGRHLGDARNGAEILRDVRGDWDVGRCGRGRRAERDVRVRGADDPDELGLRADGVGDYARRAGVGHRLRRDDRERSRDHEVVGVFELGHGGEPCGVGPSLAAAQTWVEGPQPAFFGPEKGNGPRVGCPG